MKKPPSQVAPSQGRIAARPAKDTANHHEHKPESDDRLEREIPYYYPSVANTWEELEDFVTKANYHIQHGGPTP
jgi:hypothetical protein